MNPDTPNDISRIAKNDSQPLRNLRRTVVLLSLMAVLFGAVFSWLSWRTEYDRQSTQLAVVAEMGERALNAYLGSLDKALQILAEDIWSADGKIDRKTADFQLQRFKKFHPELQVALVTEVGGQILSTSESRPRDSLPSLAAEPSFIISREELQRGARISISHVFRGLVSGEWIIPIRYGIRDGNGTLRYMLSVGLPVSKTYSFWKDAPLPQGAALGLIRDDLYVVSRYPTPAGMDYRKLFGQAQTGALSQYLQENNFPRSGVIDGMSSISSIATVFAFRRLQDYPLTLGINNPKSNIWAAWWRNVRVPLLLIALWIVAGLALYRWVQKQQRTLDTEQETRLRLAIDAARVGLWTRDFQSNALQWSAEFKRLLGYAPGELNEGHDDWLDRLHPDEREGAMRLLRGVLDGTIKNYETEMRLRHRDGTYRTILSRAILLRWPDLSPRLLIGAVVDITERKQAEEILRQNEQNLAITLQSIGDAVIATDAAGLITRMNPAAEHLTGWPFAQAAGRPLSDVFRIFNAHTGAQATNPVQLVMAHGKVVGLANHTMLIARDGREYQIADSAAPIRDNAGTITGVVMVFSDVTQRYQMEAKLRASEQRLRGIFETAPQCVKVVSPGGDLLEMNAAGLAMLEAASLDEVKSHPLLNFVAPEYRADFAGLHQRVMRGEKGALEFEVIGLRGTRRWLETRAAPMADADTGAVLMLGITQDITERKQAEHARARLSAIVENSHDAIISRALDGTILTWNAGAEKILGYTAAEAIGQSITQSMPPGRQPHFPEHNAALLRGEVIARESARKTKDGRIIEVWTSVSPIRDGAGNITGASVILQDITALKRAQAAVEESEARFRLTFDQAAVGMVLVGLDQRYIIVNQKFADMTGYTRAELQGMSIANIGYASDVTLATSQRQQLLDGEIDSIAAERRFARKDGGVFWARRTLSLARDASGKPLYFVGISEDITERKEMEERYRTTFDNAPVGIMHTAIDGYTILHANRKLCEMLGYTLDELLHMTSTQIVHPDFRFKDLPRYKDPLIRGELATFSSERKYLRKDGSPVWVNRTLSLVNDAAGTPQYFIRIIEDITIRKQAEEARARLAAALEGSSDAIFIRNMDKKIVFWNEGATRMYGYTPEEVLGDTSDFLVPPELLEERRRGWEQVLLGRSVVDFESRRRRKDGVLLDVSISVSPVKDENGNVTGAATVARDITERKLATAARALLATIVENSTEAIISRCLDGTITSWNAAAEKMFGYSASEAVGRPINLIMPDAHGNVVQDHTRLLAAGKTIPSAEVERPRKDGSMVRVIRSISPIRNEAQEIIGAAVIMHDISALKQAEEARAALELQLRQSQKMEAIGTLAGGIAHDFNNIIAIVLGNVELARRDAVAGAPIAESLAEIHKAGSRARDLVQQILSFSRRQPTERKHIDLAPVVAESARLLRATLPASLRLEIHCEPDTPFVLADANQIQQALINLATNAMQAIRGPGSIVVRLDAVMLDAERAKSWPTLNQLYRTHPGRTVRLAVKDTGAGMELATLSRIFEPFFTTKPPGEGTGLGLSVVHGIMEGHEGAITVESHPGQGTTFNLYFPEAAPMSIAPATGNDTASGTTPSHPGKDKRIIYIDDDESLVFLVERILTRAGYRISAYTDQAQALAALRKDPHAYDLVVSDYNMPGMSGLDVAREVRAIRPDLPVAVTSGFIDEHLRAHAMAAGVKELVFKVISVEEYCSAIQRLV